jgi:uncharacterized RDD family membrane protein YckC
MSEQQSQAPAPEPSGAPPEQPAWQGQGPSGPRASFGRRLVAVIVDSVVLLVVYGILFAIADDVVAYGVTLLVGLLYYALLEGGPRGQTLGKMALDIRVVDFRTGGQIGYGRGVLRYIGRIISSIPCYLGYLWMLWDREKQTWHDKIATTVVVPVDFYPLRSS